MLSLSMSVAIKFHGYEFTVVSVKWELACHMGSSSFTYHPTEATFPTKPSNHEMRCITNRIDLRRDGLGLTVEFPQLIQCLSLGIGQVRHLVLELAQKELDPVLNI